MRSSGSEAAGKVDRWAYGCLAVAMDDADHDMGRRRAVGEGVSGGWEGAISGVIS